MQRYRVNYPLLIGLVVGMLALTGAVYGLWRYQVSANAGWYSAEAEKAEQEGDLRDAFKKLLRYTNLKKSDTEARERLARLSIRIVKSDDATIEDIQNGMAILERTMREQPENAKLRREYVDLLLSPKLGAANLALPHVNELVNADPKNPELLEMQANCLFNTNDKGAFDNGCRLVGFDPNTATFDDKKATAPQAEKVYYRLATILRTDRSEAEQADQMMNQMIKRNENSAEAYYQRALYMLGTNRVDEAKKDLEASLKLDPDDPAALVTNSRVLISEKKLDEAREQLERVRKNHPDNIEAYEYLAKLALAEENYDRAIEWYDEGVKATTSFGPSYLLFYKARLQLDRSDADAARETIKELRRVGKLNPAFLTHLDARLLLNEEKWFEAATEFKKVQSVLSNVGDLAEEVNYLLGFCYEKLGQLELARDCYDLVLQANPNNPLAVFGQTRVAELKGGDDSPESLRSMYAALDNELRKPKSEQNWDSFDTAITEYAKRVALDKPSTLLLQAEMKLRRGDFPGARKLLIEANKLAPDNLSIRRGAVKLVALDPDSGPTKALSLLDDVVKKFGDKPILRLDRADLLVATNDEQVKTKLMDLSKGSEKWNKSEQVQLWTGLASVFERIRDRESAEDCLDKVAEIAPGDLASLMRRFMMAREAGDDAGMKSMQEKIERVVGSKEHPNWMFSEAHRLVSLAQRGQAELTVLDDADKLLQQCLDQRPEWNEPYLLQAQIRLAKGDIDGAVSLFDRAASYGPSSAVAIYQHVKLLGAKGRYKDARKILDKLNPDARAQLLGQEYSEILFNTGSEQEALRAANAVIEADPKNLAKQFWFGQFNLAASSSDKLPEDQRAELRKTAIAALEKAVTLESSAFEAWLAYINSLVSDGQMGAAEDALRRAQLALSEDQSVLMLARCYELMGRWFDAKNLYQGAVERMPDDYRVKRLLAQFYLGKGYPRDDGNEQAIPLVNEILKAAADSKLEANDPQVIWARRTGAQLLAGTNEYQNLLSAEKLLTSSVVEGEMSVDDKLELAKILAPRPEPISRSKAARLLEDVKRNRPLEVDLERMLGALYYKLGDWERCRRQMIDLFSRYPDDKQARVDYLNMLLDRGNASDIDEATRQLRRLVEIAPNEPQTLELVARVSSRNGRREDAIAALRRILPKNFGEMDKESVPLVTYVARLLADAEDYEMADRLYRFAAAKGDSANQLNLAIYLGKHGDMAEAVDMIAALRGQVPDADRLSALLEVTRERRDEIGDKYDAKIDQVMESAIREEPDLLDLQLLKAEILDLRLQHEEAANLYREVLKRDDLVGIKRAIALNNLAYLLATTVDDTAQFDEAIRYVNEAAEILGPTADLLDTRAVVNTAAKRYDEAIADLDLSLTENPTPSKYFHKARAHFLAGQNQLAVRAWERAVDAGLSRDKLSAVERTQFDELKAKLEGLGLLSAQ